ncbi:hypothetical protein DRP43_00200 [candidate division TA06 bacterium]|uniref:TldD/PmbA family protein n=1 Tax=candidate division TA06 bacterium TaxID=2250710 RepID=A0A660SPI0_UNCT6|nr:MAG: hypothetical protein DRP43_00200 [candidate division TA06 bacterium]
MYNENFIKDIGTKIIGYSKAQQTEVFIYGNLSSLSRFSENEITQNVTQEDINISVRVIHNNRIGKATTNRIDDPSLKQLASNAFEIALFQKEDKLITPLPKHQEYEEIKDTYDKETADYSAMDRAKAIKSVTDECEKQEINAAGIFSNNTVYICLMNSKGLYAYNKSTGAEFSITATKNKRAGWAEKIAKKVKDINTLDIANIAIKKSIEGQNPSIIEPGKYTVVLEPAAVTDFISYLSFLGFGALSHIEKRSFFSGKIGEKVFSDNITISDDAYYPISQGIPFDFEGMPRKKITLIENGILKGIVYDLKTAKIAGTESTGHGLPQPNEYGPMPLNLVLKPGNATIREMIESTKRGLLITHFHYTNVLNPKEMTITGMTRDGVFLIENGEVKKPVNNMRFTESIPNIFKNVEMVGKKAILQSSFFGDGFVIPGLKVNNFTFTSKTDF